MSRAPSGARLATLRADLAPGLGALGAGAAGGLAFSLARLPMPWLLGSISGAGLAALLGARIRVRPWLRDPVLAVLGLMIGSTLHAGSLAYFARWPVTLAAVALYVAAVTGPLYWFLRRFAGFDPVTAYCSAAPGAFMAMAAIGGALGGRARSIALAHAVRLVIVIFVIVTAYHVALGPGGRGFVPLAALSPLEGLLLLALGGAGYALARLVRLPAAAMLGPLLAAAAAKLTGLVAVPVPTLPLLAAELVVGSGIGADFSGAAPGELLRGMLLAGVSVAYMLLVSLAFCYALVPLTGSSFAALFLALSPGGMSGVALVALALGIEPAFVTVHNVFRVLLILLGGPVVFRMTGAAGTDPD